MSYRVLVLGLCALGCEVAAPTSLAGSNVEAAVSGLGDAPAAAASSAAPVTSAPAGSGASPGAGTSELPLGGVSLDAPALDAGAGGAPDAGFSSAAGPDAGAADEAVAEDDPEPSGDDGDLLDDDGDDGDGDDRDREDDGDAEESPASPPPLVTVSFTFDDTYGPQREAAAILEAHGLRGTFYVNSPQLHRASANPGPGAALSIDDVLGLQTRGHDIGGHTLGHLSLTDIPESERVREILGDRAELMRLGIEARSFAYPYGHVENDDPALGRSVLEITRDSGYESARDTNGFDLGRL